MTQLAVQAAPTATSASKITANKATIKLKANDKTANADNVEKAKKGDNISAEKKQKKKKKKKVGPKTDNAELKSDEAGLKTDATGKKIDKTGLKKKPKKVDKSVKASSSLRPKDGATEEENKKKHRKRWKKKPSITATFKKVTLTGTDLSSNWAQLLKENVIKVNVKPKKKVKIAKSTTKETPAEEDASFIKPDEIWFDDVDEILLDRVAPPTATEGDDTPTTPTTTDTPTSETQEPSGAEAPSSTDSKLIKHGATDGVTNTIAMDCEMVGVGDGGVDSILARCSVVNQYGKCIYDVFVKPTEKVTDLRTHVSGVRNSDLLKGVEFSECQKKVASLMKGRILVGHAIQNDLKVLFLDHPRKRIRDTSRYKPFRALFNGRNPSLKKLTNQVLGVKVQAGEHSSIQDAQATMRLYTFHKSQWEKSLKMKRTPKVETPENKE